MWVRTVLHITLFIGTTRFRVLGVGVLLVRIRFNVSLKSQNSCLFPLWQPVVCPCPYPCSSYKENGLSNFHQNNSQYFFCYILTEIKALFWDIRLLDNTQLQAFCIYSRCVFSASSSNTLLDVLSVGVNKSTSWQVRRFIQPTMQTGTSTQERWICFCCGVIIQKHSCFWSSEEKKKKKKFSEHVLLSEKQMQETKAGIIKNTGTAG